MGRTSLLRTLLRAVDGGGLYLCGRGVKFWFVSEAADRGRVYEQWQFSPCLTTSQRVIGVIVQKSIFLSPVILLSTLSIVRSHSWVGRWLGEGPTGMLYSRNKHALFSALSFVQNRQTFWLLPTPLLSMLLSSYWDNGVCPVWVIIGDRSIW